MIRKTLKNTLYKKRSTIWQNAAFEQQFPLKSALNLYGSPVRMVDCQIVYSLVYINRTLFAYGHIENVKWKYTHTLFLNRRFLSARAAYLQVNRLKTTRRRATRT